MGMLSRLVRTFVGVNCRLSARADQLALRWTGRTRGLQDFSTRVVPRLLRPGLRVLDVGGGRAPCVDVATVRRLDLHVTGFDVSAGELASAPQGSYNAMIVGDAGGQPISGCYDLIFSRTVLEHVADPRAALSNLAAALAEGGVMAHFVPCRNAPFAVLNRLLGERFSQRLLWSVYPETKGIAGFPAYYRDCVPSRMAAACRDVGLEVVETEPYFASEYLRFFAPAHLLDLCRQVFLQTLGATDLAETFVIIARKPAIKLRSEERPGNAVGGLRAA
jgi:2-polyprenyl-6-hydroxyphenyl methylase/3-demethylubiquinone-9 3-methyltransferase